MQRHDSIITILTRQSVNRTVGDFDALRKVELRSDSDNDSMGITLYTDVGGQPLMCDRERRI